MATNRKFKIAVNWCINRPKQEVVGPLMSLMPIILWLGTVVMFPMVLAALWEQEAEGEQVEELAQNHPKASPTQQDPCCTDMNLRILDHQRDSEEWHTRHTYEVLGNTQTSMLLFKRSRVQNCLWEVRDAQWRGTSSSDPCSILRKFRASVAARHKVLRSDAEPCFQEMYHVCSTL